jgi:ribonuclease G
MAELHSQLARDRVKTSVSDFSQLGLVEMTRKRTRESLERLLCQPCAACQGRGTVKTPRTVAYEVFREILREARQFNPREFGVLVHPSVLELLQDEESEHLAELSAFIGKPIALRVELGFRPDQFDIVLA